MRTRKQVRQKHPINKRIIGSIVFILLLVTVVVGTDARPTSAQAPGDFPEIRLTGVDGSGAKRPSNVEDLHWRIQRIYNERASEGWSTCQYRNGNSSLPIDNGQRPAITIREYPIPGMDRAGQNFGPTPGNAGNAPWALTSTNARWIGQNQYGRSHGHGYGNIHTPGSNYCYDPGYAAGNPSPSGRQWGGSPRPGDVSTTATSPVLFDRTGPPPPYIPIRNLNNYVFRYFAPRSDINLTNIDPDTISLTINGTADDLIGIVINGVPLDIDCGGGPSTTVAQDPANGFNVPICSPGFAALGTFTARVRPGTFAAAPGRRAGEVQTFDVYVKSAFSNTGFMFTNIEWHGDPYPPSPECVSGVSFIDIGSNATPEPDQPFRVRVSIDTPIPPGTGSITIGGPPSDNTYSIASWTHNSGNQYTAETPSGVYRAAGAYTVSWTAMRAGTTIVLLNCSETISVNAKPYLQVFGNDVAAGSYFDTGSCAEPGPTHPSRNAGIFTYTRSPIPTWRAGAGTQLAAFATGEIRDFISTTNRLGGSFPFDSIPPKNPYGLVFSNTGSKSGNLFGGNSGISRCIPDYYSYNPGTSSGDITVHDDGDKDPNDTYTISGPGQYIVPLGHQEVYFVDGNMVINGTINADPGGAANVSQIPSFHLIVKGNIYINRTVDTLHGVYIAQPRDDDDDGQPDPGTGIIYTCSNGPNLWSSNALYDQCGVRLKVSGEFIAHEVRFLRTGNTVRQSNPGDYLLGSAAERFIFSPEIYLAPQPEIFMRAGGGSRSPYDAFINLPPIL